MCTHASVCAGHVYAYAWAICAWFPTIYQVPATFQTPCGAQEKAASMTDSVSIPMELTLAGVCGHVGLESLFLLCVLEARCCVQAPKGELPSAHSGLELGLILLCDY